MGVSSHRSAKLVSAAWKSVACVTTLLLVASLGLFQLWIAPQAAAEGRPLEVFFEFSEDDAATVVLDDQEFDARSTESYTASTGRDLRFTVQVREDREIVAVTAAPREGSLETAETSMPDEASAVEAVSVEDASAIAEVAPATDDAVVEISIESENNSSPPLKA